MKRAVIIIIVLTFIFGNINEISAQDVERREKGNLVIEGIPEIPDQLKDRMNQYLNTRSASFQGWDAEGEGMYILTRFGETSQVHYVEKPGGYRQQLTFFEEPVGGLSVRPQEGNPGFLFSKDIGGNEKYQIYYYDSEAGAYFMHTDGKSRNTSFVWSNSGDSYAYISNKRNGRDFDVYAADMDNPEEPEMVYQAQGYWAPMDWSNDDKELLLINYISINESSIHILNLETKEIKPLMETEGKVAFGGGEFANKGNGVYFTTDMDSEFKKLHYLNRETGEIEVLTEDISWDVSGFIQSDDGEHIVFIVNENAMSKPYLMDTKEKAYDPFGDLPPGLISSGEFTPDGEHIAFSFTNPQTAGDVYTINIANGDMERWTYSEVGGLQTENFVFPKLIEYETFDKEDGKPRKIPAFYYKPAGEGPFPVVIYLHGGPESQFRPYFISTFQYWVKELGIAVLAPNVRGSAGYGKSYLKMDNAYKRENSVKDAGKLLDWIKKQPELNENKTAVYGGSYGGYMSLAMMTHYNDRLAAGVDIVGISNFVTFLVNTGDYRRDLRRVEYGDERDPKMREFLEEISPLNNADKITKPLFVVQGLNDPRVPASEAEQIVAEVRDNGGNVWYLLAKDEGHGFSKKTNRDYYIYSVVLFFRKFLL